MICPTVVRSPASMPRAPNPNRRRASSTRWAFRLSGLTRMSRSAVNRGYPYQATANAPTTTYSTPFELSNSTNSRKSLLSGIWIKTVPEFDHNLNALFGRLAGVFVGIGFVGRLSTSENLNNFLHCFNCIGFGSNDTPLDGAQSLSLTPDPLFPIVRKTLNPRENRVRIQVRFGDHIRFQTTGQPLVVPVGGE